MSKNDTVTQVYKVLGRLRIEVMIKLFFVLLSEVMTFISLDEYIFTVYVDVTIEELFRHVEPVDIIFP